MARSAERPGVPRVLVVDDDAPVRNLIVRTLTADYEIETAGDGKEGFTAAQQLRPNLIITDLRMPVLSGDELVRKIRADPQLDSIPILVLTAHEDEELRVRLLSEGAQDYVTKPFSMGELLARMRVALRHRMRGETGADGVVEVGPLRIDHAKRRVTVDGTEVKLTPIEYRLLAELGRHPGRVLTHEHLLREVWGPSYTSQHHYLRVYMAQLRQKIEKNAARPQVLLTEPGVGYRMREP